MCVYIYIYMYRLFKYLLYSVYTVPQWLKGAALHAADLGRHYSSCVLRYVLKSLCVNFRKRKRGKSI